MGINEVLKRINELAAKKKAGHTLTSEEEAEKKELYEIYLGFIRGQITQQLERIEFVDVDASGKPISKIPKAH